MALFDPAFPSAVVRGPDLPAPAEGLYALAPLAVVLLALTVVVLVRRRRERARAPRRAGIMAGFALSAALGNALVEMNALFDSSRPVAMVMQGDVDRPDPAPGDGRDPETPPTPLSPQRP